MSNQIKVFLFLLFAFAIASDEELVAYSCKNWRLLFEQGKNFTFIYEGCKKDLVDPSRPDYTSFVGYLIGQKKNCILLQLPEEALRTRYLSTQVDWSRFNALHLMLQINQLECVDEIAQKFPFLLKEKDAEGRTPNFQKE